MSNLHADTLEQARDHIVRQNGATEDGFLAFGIFIPIVLKRTNRSRFHLPHVIEIFHAANGRWVKAEIEGQCTDREIEISAFIDDCLQQECRRVEDVRSAWLAGR